MILRLRSQRQSGTLRTRSFIRNLTRALEHLRGSQLAKGPQLYSMMTDGIKDIFSSYLFPVC